MMKKVFVLIIFLFFSLSICSCENNDISIATAYDDIFQYDAKSYSFNNVDTLDDIEYYVSDDIYYSTEDISDNTNDYDYILNLNFDGIEYSFSFEGYINNVYYLDGNLFIIRYVDDYEDTMSTAMIISELVDNDIEDVYEVLNCNEGYSLLTYIDDYYYLYYFNNSSLNLCYAQLDFNDSDVDDYEVDTEIITSGTNIVQVVVINPLEFYFIDNISLYYYCENGDGIFDTNDFTFVCNDVTYIYQDNDDIYFYEVECDRIISNTTVVIKKYTISIDSDGDYETDKDEIISENYFLRFCDYYCYDGQIFIFFDDFLGIIQYDCSSGEIYSYYDDAVSISDEYGNDNYLIFSIDSSDDDQNYYLLNLME